MTTKKYFAFLPQEIACAFQHARPKKQINGLKLLHAPTSCAVTGLEYGKLLIITPRASGKAHDRNRIKRQFRALFYEEKLFAEPALWILLVRKDAMSLSFEQLKQFLYEAFEK